MDDHDDSDIGLEAMSVWKENNVPTSIKPVEMSAIPELSEEDSAGDQTNGFIISTAFHVPSKLLPYAPPDACANSPSSLSSSSSSSPSSSDFPIRVVSERKKGIAFQLWPAARAFAQFMMQMQHDQSVATPMKNEYNRKEREQAAGDVDTAPANPSPSSSSSTPDTSATPVTPLPSSSSSSSPAFTSTPYWWSHQRVLELGAGCGLNGILAAALGSESVITDLAPVLDHMKLNIRHNFAADAEADGLTQWTEMRKRVATRISACALGWGEPSLPAGIQRGDFSVILLSDCIYWEELFGLLLDTLRKLAGPSTRIFICQLPRRPKVEKRFYKAAQKYFQLNLIQQIPEKGQKRPLQLFELKLKQ